MAVTWTKEQREVIDSRNRNLLVSAAAGSGKTAVLVERIISMITDKASPMDLDRLLVMTFTNAAAAEMRERIGDAVRKKLEQQPENEHLALQASLIHHCQITTIDSFCLHLIREYYNQLEIDPSFRIGDEGELSLLRSDVLEEMLEDYYGRKDEKFENFVETFSRGKTDFGIADVIMQVYRFSQSYPWPEEWISGCLDEVMNPTKSIIENSGWMKFLLEDIRLQMEEMTAHLKAAIKICREEDGPAPYLPMITEDLQTVERIRDVKDFDGLLNELSRVSFSRLAAVRSRKVDEEKKDYVSAVRKRTQALVKKCVGCYGSQTMDDILKAMEQTRDASEMLLCLAGDFEKRFQAAKRERNMVDFNDLEHMALKILWTEPDENHERVPSETADQLSGQYEEILVDEYQDSNFVQEMLVRAVSRERFGQPNVFMVGDVKQSIYRFRLARPELFMEKYQTYTKEDSPYKKIELHKNFRSRASVLESINDIFYLIMTKNLGGIEYTDDEALYPGAVFEETTEKAGTPTELLMMETELRTADGDLADATVKELEARMIARRMKELTDEKSGMVVWDKKINGYRRARYGDMVILLRGISGWAETFVNVLMNEGIPAYAESRMGYFTSTEVETVLSLLAVIDNPIQDIPLAAVMKSPIGGFSDEELSWMTADYKRLAEKPQDRGIYGAWKLALETENSSLSEKTRDKLQKLKELLEGLRKKALYLPVHELLYQIYEETGYYSYVSAMPAGEVRRANLDMLVEKASAFEKTSYKGLFHFIRYIERLKKYNTDFGEASAAGGQENTVRIMSIHKSKGLEFPIVFLSGMGKRFNKQDAYAPVLIDPDFGIAADAMDVKLRIKRTTLKKQVLKRRMEMEAVGEELRVLYVAMTRAKEKLILTAADRNRLALLNPGSVPVFDGQIPYTILSSAVHYMDWILMSASTGQLHLDIKMIPAFEVAGEGAKRQVERFLTKEELLSWGNSFSENGEKENAHEKELRRRMEFLYPYGSDTRLYAKMSVSEIKRQWQQKQEEISAELFSETPAADKADKKTQKQRAFRGTAFHRALELLSYREINSREDVNTQLGQLELEGRLSAEQRRVIASESIWKFASGSLGQRMRAAEAENRLYRERQFMIGIPARELQMGDSEELVLIQGIIDAYLEEDGELVLIDYKTDKVRNASVLKERYRIQMDYYQKALEQITGKRVKERMIYSLELQKEIMV